MPIVSISKIQHRYGLSENLPQLSAAELGWVIDRRKLFIGNGPTSEGAPVIGNTEILTEFSEIVQNVYSYKALAVGYEAITGQSLSTPTIRSFQEKFDDVANVRDYGATGNGVDDDTVSINRALIDLYTRDANVAVRRVLYFPAGKYLINDVIKIPPYATLQGEGKNCTIITATNGSVACVARIVDSKLQIGANIGSNDAILPNYIAVNDLTFNANNLSIDVFIAESTKYVSFRRVGFDGGKITAPTTAGSQLAALQIFSAPINVSSNIVFEDCEFSNTNYAAILDDDMDNIVFDKCTFKKLYLGIKVGENTVGSGSSIFGPRGLRITNSLFDEIYNSALVNYQFAKVSSAFNTYLDVGNQNISNPTYPAILFTAGGSSSICDVFARTDVENLTVPRVSYGSTKSIYIESSSSVFVGKKQIEAGNVITLNNNTAVATNTSISFTVSQKTQKINYIATRSTGVRNGTLEITATAAGITYSDTFTDNDVDIGLTLSAIVSGSNVLVRYVTTNTGNDITFSYSVERNLT